MAPCHMISHLSVSHMTRRIRGLIRRHRENAQIKVWNLFVVVVVFAAKNRPSCRPKRRLFGDFGKPAHWWHLLYVVVLRTRDQFHQGVGAFGFHNLARASTPSSFLSLGQVWAKELWTAPRLDQGLF